MKLPARAAIPTLCLAAAAAVLTLHCTGAGGDPADQVGRSKQPITLGAGAFVGDLNQAPLTLAADVSSTPTNFVELGGTLYFSATEKSSGTELWRSDGTEAGTWLVADIAPGSDSAAPANLTVVGSKVFFTANDGVHGAELWSTDGTGPGTQLVVDLNPGSASASPTGLAEFAGQLFFAATHPTSGNELWRTDGTAGGTQLVVDLNPGTASASPKELVQFANALYFSADDGTSGTEVWRTDGMTGGTVRVTDINPGAGSSAPANLTPVGPRLFFSATDGVTGHEVYWLDAQGTVTFTSDLGAGNNSGTSGNGPHNFFAYTHANKNLLIFAHLGSSGREPHVSDGTPAGTHLLKDLNTSGSGHAFLTGTGWENSFTLFNGEVYFKAQGDGTSTELFKTDGTNQGTVLVADIIPGTTSGNPKLPIAFAQHLYFIANSTGFGEELMRVDAQGNLELVADINPGTSSSSPSGFTPLGAALYFAASDGASGASRELWKTEGGPGAALVKDINPANTAAHGPVHLVALGNQVVYAGSESSTSGNVGKEPWVSDGTPNGSRVLADVRPGTTGSNPAELTELNGIVIFAAEESTTTSEPGRELWRTDGTPAGTLRIKNMNPNGSGVGNPAYLTRIGSHVYFAGTDGVAVPGEGTELWRTDGTDTGTIRVKDVNPGRSITTNNAFSSLPQHLTVVGSTLFFSATNGTDITTGGVGRELWMSDGTELGTVLVKDLNLGTGNSNPANLTALGNLLVFTATDGVTGVELWVSDGTEPGTTLLADVSATSAGTTSGSGFGAFTVAGNLLFFVANDGASGAELWVTNGTPAGTQMVMDIMPGATGSSPAQLTAVGSRLFFVADDGVNGAELWTTDGTLAGTLMLSDLLPGAGSSAPSDLAALGTQLFFAARDPVNGRELWVSDGTTAGTTLVRDILPGLRSSQPTAITALEDLSLVVFGADDGELGHEPWVSDGTAAGTRRVADLNPGPLPSSPERFFRAGDHVFVVASHQNYGALELAVLVIQDEPPVITCPANILVEATEPGGIAVSFAATATDDVTAQPAITYSHAPGSVFAPGQTTVTATAEDEVGNESSCTFVITVDFEDVTPPQISCPQDVSVTVHVQSGGTVTYPAATATDDVTANPAISYSHPSGDTFPVGPTTVTATATDDAGNEASCTFTVTVVFEDNTDPTITCPADAAVVTHDRNGAEVTYPAATATDDATLSPDITYSHASGASFPVGATQVTATATDEAGNSASCTFTVTVSFVDVGAPAITCPENVAVTTQNADGVAVEYPAATATDEDDPTAPSLAYSHPLDATFPVGATEVTATATDSAGNSASCTFTVTVTLENSEEVPPSGCGCGAGGSGPGAAAGVLLLALGLAARRRLRPALD